MPVPFAFTSRRKVPLPLMPETVTSYRSPDPLTLVMVPIAIPVELRIKSSAPTPVTDSLKETRKVTVLALVVSVVGLWRVIPVTTGAVASIVQV